VAFSLTAVLRVARVPLPVSLKQASAGGVAGKDRRRSALAVFRIALGLVLRVLRGAQAARHVAGRRRPPPVPTRCSAASSPQPQNASLGKRFLIAAFNGL